MLPDGPFTQLKQSKDNLLHTGFDYKGQVMRRVMSKQMFRTNQTMLDFIRMIDSVVYELIESVKLIKTFGNPALDKNERRIV